MSCLFNNVSFLSYLLNLMPSMNDLVNWKLHCSVNLVVVSILILNESIHP